MKKILIIFIAIMMLCIFGAAAAALFCCLRLQNTRRLPRFFYALFAGCGSRGTMGLFF